mgnify:CR=1 FL=1
MSHSFHYLRTDQVEGEPVDELLERLKHAGFDMELYALGPGKLDRLALAFLSASDSEALGTVSERRLTLHIIIDTEPPSANAALRNVVHIKPDDILDWTPLADSLLSRIARHLDGEHAGDSAAIPISSLERETMDRQLEDSLRRKQAAREKEIKQRTGRVQSFLSDSIWEPVVTLPKKPDWSPETSYAYIAAIAAEKAANKSAQEADEKLGESLGHLRIDASLRPLTLARLRIGKDQIYRGETNGFEPHGYGVMDFGDGKTFCGEFIEGRITGWGVGRQKKIRWSGGWRDSEPTLTGVFEQIIGQDKRGVAQGVVLKEHGEARSILVWHKALDVFSGLGRRIGFDL